MWRKILQSLDFNNLENLNSKKTFNKDSIKKMPKVDFIKICKTDSIKFTKVDSIKTSKKDSTRIAKIDSIKKLKVDSIKSQNLKKFPFIILMLLAFSNFAHALKESDSGQRNGFIANIILGFDYINQTNGTTLFSNIAAPNNTDKVAQISGARSTIGAEIGWNFRDYAKLEFNVLVGFAPSRVRGNFLSGFESNILVDTIAGYYTFKDINYTNIAFGGKIGYNFSSITKNFNHAIFLNLGFNFNIIDYGSFIAYRVNESVIFAELEGSKKLSSRFRLEYKAQIGYRLAFISLNGDAGNYYNNINDSINGFNSLLSLGFLYNLTSSGSLAFFMRTNIAYNYLAAERYGRIVTTPVNNINNMALDVGVSTLLKYPATYMLSSGIDFGFRF